MQVTKELPRQGFLYSGFKRNEADSVAAHSFNVIAFSYLLARELKSTGMKIDPDKVFNIALFHDMGEAITGDIGTFVKDMAEGVFDKVEKKAFDTLVRNLSSKKELTGYFEEYIKLKSKEAQVVKIADALDALAQGLNTPSAKISDWKYAMENISKSKFKDRRLAKIFNDCVGMLINKEVTYFRGHIDKGGTNQKKLN